MRRWLTLLIGVRGSLITVRFDGERAHEMQHAAADLRVLDALEGERELQALGACKEPFHGRGFGRRARMVYGRVFEVLGGEADRHVEDGGDIVQAPRADAVEAALILLDLLKGDAKQRA